MALIAPVIIYIIKIIIIIIIFISGHRFSNMIKQTTTLNSVICSTGKKKFYNFFIDLKNAKNKISVISRSKYWCQPGFTHKFDEIRMYSYSVLLYDAIPVYST